MLSELCVRRPVFATMMVMSLVVLGIFSFRDLGVDLFPRADPATVNVTLSLPGASPDEISSSVVEPMEQAISGVSGIDEISARISEGTGNITVRFVLERDLNDAVNDVREKVAGAIKSVPPELLPPVITKVDPDADPVMTLVVSSDSMSLRTLTELADKQVSRAIQTVERRRPGHHRRQPRPRDPHRRRRGEAQLVRPVDVAGARRGRGRERGNPRRRGRAGQGPAAAAHDGPHRRLRGLQQHRRLDQERHADSRVGPRLCRGQLRAADLVGVADGDKPAVLLDIRRAMGENTVSVIEGVRAQLQTIQRTLPKSVKLTVTRDDSKFIYASVASLEEHLIFGSLFAAVVVMFFIRNLRAVIIASLAIPASIISSFTLMRVMGFSLNNMTLLGITLAVGIVIDDAIVVLENIFRYIEEKNCTPFEAAIKGTREVALAVMATTLSLVVIFLPIAFMNGYAKRFINPFGWTMAFSILVSMLVSFTLTPMLSSRFLKLSDALADHKTKEHGIFHWMDQMYSRQVRWALDHSGVIIAISVVTFLLTFPLNRMVGRDFVPNEDMGEWTVHMDSPEGTALEGTEELAFRVLKDVQGIEGVAEIQPIVNPGGSGAAGGGGGGSATHFHFNFIAQPAEDRKRSQSEMIRELRQRLAKYPANRPSISARNALGSGEGQGGFAISANILGPDLRQLTEYSMKALEMAQHTPSLTEPEAEPERVESGNPRRGGSAARGRPRRAHVDHRRHAAAGGRG